MSLDENTLRAVVREELRAALEETREDVILTREQAARQLKVSVRQLQRLVRAGRLMAHPSGIARAELERYAKTPQTRLTEAAVRVRRSSVTQEAVELKALLRLRRKRR